MKFELTTTEYGYEKEDANKLKQLGFEFIYRDNYYSKNDKDISIEINSLDDLMNLIKEYGQIVINESKIEIYDGYRE